MPKRFAPLAVPTLALALLAASGCGESESRMNRKTVEIAKVPAPLLDAGKKALPGVDFTEAWTNHEPGKEAIHSYEIRGKNPSTGKIREVRLAPDGKVLEME